MRISLQQLKYFVISLGMLVAFGILSRPAFAYTNLINNASVETVSASNTPSGWQHSGWGTNTAAYSYRATGQGGSAHSVYTKVTNYQDGDAKWFFDPVTVLGSTQYIYADYYKSDVATELVAAITMNDGSTVYQWMADIAPSTTWKLSNSSVLMPPGATKATVLHFIASNGYLQLDNATFKQPEVPAVTNGVGNSSFEQASEFNTKLPLGWVGSSWGTNTSKYTYLNTGHTGSKSVRIDVSGYTDGDAKWYSESTKVIPGKTYVYSDYYRSNVPTTVVAMFTATNGVQTYQSLGTGPKSTSWVRKGFSVNIPSNVSSVTIFHTLAANGYLILDDVSLVPQTDIDMTSGIPNGSLEQVNQSDLTAPLGWTSAGWGTNTAKYSYPATGHTGSRSVRVDITSYTDGDAKWMYATQPVTAGSNYRFSAYYQTNTTGRAVVMFTNSDGSTTYFGMHNAESSAAWAQYSDTFIAPNNAVSASVFFYINSVGYFASDDYGLSPYSYVGFDKARLSLTFDDGWEENVTTVLPRLGQYGFASTQYYATQFITDTQDTSGVLAFKNANHQIGSHTVTHPNLSIITLAQVVSELTQSKQVLEAATGQPVLDFASPYGGYNAQVITEIKKLYRSHRTVDEGYNSKDNFDIYRLKVQNVLLGTTPEQISGWISRAQQDHTWLILVFHRVGVANLEAYDTPVATFEQDLANISASGIPVQTVDQALAELQPQL